MRRKRGASLLGGLGLIGVLLGLMAGGATGEPTKRAPIRRGYDFTRPEPGEILPNPTEAVGTPPQLRAYVTVKDMATKDMATKDKATKDKPAGKAASAQEAETPVEAKPIAPQTAITPPVPAQAPDDKPPAPNPDAWRSSPTSRMTRHLETTLAKQVATLGLEGPFTYQPSPAAQADPKIAASEKRVWTRLVDSLAISWRAWQASHSSDAPQRTAGLAPAGQTGGSTQDLPAPAIAPRTAPGQIILKGADPRVIGDLSDVSPR